MIGHSLSCELDVFYMQQALRQAVKARIAQEVPIGAIIVRKGLVLGEGWNQPTVAKDPTAHAEIVALRRAAMQARNYRLPAATLYVTAEPCLMCLGALFHARIRRLVFGCRVPASGAVRSIDVLNILPRTFGLEVTEGVCAKESYELLREFFAQRRGA